MTKRLIILILCCTTALTAAAVPARPVTKTVCMADGTMQDIVLRGDEAFHFYTTLDGQPVHQNANGQWEAAPDDVATRWAAARAHRGGLRQSAPWLRKKMPLRTQAADSTDLLPKRGLLVLVNFRDVRMKWSSTPDVFRQMMNGLGCPYGRNHGSVREFFRDQSYNQFDVEFDVAGPVTLSQDMAYYGADRSDAGEDIRPAHMVKEALNAVDGSVDFSLYDWDGDGEVENVFLIYAGYSQAQGASANTIWPHQWTLTEATSSPLTLDGVKVDTYACSSELLGISGNTIDGIGTMCHEYSHCLGLPDFYDTNYKAFGMSVWSVMDQGCNNDQGFCPAGYTAYERWYCGWMEPMRLDTACTVTALRNLEDYPEAYIIYNDNNPSEYYLLANHQQVGWNTHAYGHGMMILHVDYNQKAWADNKVNNYASHQRMTIVPADNKLGSWATNLQGDLWPGSVLNSTLTDDSKPAASVFTANTDGTYFLRKPIYAIKENDGLISFRFMQEMPDGIQNVSASPASQRPALYDLSGRRSTLRKARPGIYIRRGHKVIMP